MFNDQLLMIVRHCGLHEMLIRSTHIPQAIQNIVFTWLNIAPRIVTTIDFKLMGINIIFEH